MKFIDNLKTMEFKSVFDNKTSQVLISLPLDFKESKKYPLIVSPHPFGWSHFENFTSGAPDLLYNFKGWSNISNKFKVIIVFPLGHGKFYEKISLAYEGQIRDLISIPDIIEKAKIKTDTNRMFISGLSMGGMETLTAMGMHPGVFKAGFSFNAIADLAAWYRDVKCGVVDKKLSDMDTLSLVENEIGGSPDKIAQEYDKRSAVNYIENFANANLMIYWSSKDSIVTGAETSQGKKLFDMIKEKYPVSNIYEHEHTYEHGFTKFDRTECIKCHEYSDFNIAANWFLKNW